MVNYETAYNKHAGHRPRQNEKMKVKSVLVELR